MYASIKLKQEKYLQKISIHCNCIVSLTKIRVVGDRSGGIKFSELRYAKSKR